MKVISPETLRRNIAAGTSICLLDVRTPGEYASGHIAQAMLQPLQSLDAAAVANQQGGVGACIYVICQSGSRARRAVEQLEAAGMSNCVLVEGGMSAWVKAGFEVERQGKGVISLERQVRIAAGFLAFGGTLLGAFVHPGLLVIPGAVGAGLMFAGISDICGMGLLLARMPWNQVSCATNEKACCGVEA